MRSPLTETVERVKGMVVYVRENLSLEEYDLFLDMVAPEPLPEVKKSQKKAGKKSASKSSGKSVRASGMASAISRSLESSRQATATVTDDDDEFKQKVQQVVLDDDTVRCQFTRADNRPCHLLPDHNIHHLESAAEYHEFVPPATDAARAAAGE